VTYISLSVTYKTIYLLFSYHPIMAGGTLATPDAARTAGIGATSRKRAIRRLLLGAAVLAPVGWTGTGSIGSSTIVRARPRDAGFQRFELIRCADLAPELAEIRKGKPVKRISRGQIGALAVASIALSLTACSTVASSSTASSGTTSGTAAAAKSITIAGVYGDTFDPFWVTLGCGAQEEAAKLGVQYKAFSSTADDTATFSQLFSSAQLVHPSGVFVNPLNPNQFVTQYKTLMSQGVPVVTINSTTPPAQYQVVGTDTKAAPFLQQVAGLVPSSSGSMVVVNGVPGLVPVEVRLDPVVNAITSAHPGLKMLPTIYSGFDITKATAAVSSLLIANPDLKVIVAADGPDGQAAAAAVQEAGKSGKVTVISLDATPAEVAALKSGVITALVAQSPLQIGEQQVKTLVDYIRAHPNGGAVAVTSTTVGIPQYLLTKSNINAPTSSPWIYKSSCSS
jgi:ribose transport system substrate-binding protein